MKVVLFGKGSLTGTKSGGRKCNAAKWEVTKVTPGLLAWVSTVVVSGSACSISL